MFRFFLLLVVVIYMSFCHNQLCGVAKFDSKAVMFSFQTAVLTKRQNDIFCKWPLYVSEHISQNEKKKNYGFVALWLWHWIWVHISAIDPLLKKALNMLGYLCLESFSSLTCVHRCLTQQLRESDELVCEHVS